MVQGKLMLKSLDNKGPETEPLSLLELLAGVQ